MGAIEKAQTLVCSYVHSKTARRRDLLEVEDARDGFMPSHEHIAQ